MKRHTGGQIIDMTGQRFGALIVQQMATHANPGHAEWVCECDCGTSGYIARGTKLRRGEIVSCGCRRANPEIRRSARYKLDTELRSAIARLGGCRIKGTQ